MQSWSDTVYKTHFSEQEDVQERKLEGVKIVKDRVKWSSKTVFGENEKVKKL